MIDALIPQGRSKTLVLQLRDELVRAIRSGGMRPGDRLPSETELADRFGVSRSSVREALKLLEQDGLITVQHGSGRFVSASAGLVVNRSVTRFESVTDLLRSLGYEATVRVLAVERGAPTKEERAALGLAPGVDVVRARRARLHDGRALGLSLNTFSAELLGEDDVGAADLSGSLTEWLRARGHLPVSSAAEIRAAALPPAEAALPEFAGETRGVDDDQGLGVFDEWKKRKADRAAVAQTGPRTSQSFRIAFLKQVEHGRPDAIVSQKPVAEAQNQDAAIPAHEASPHPSRFAIKILRLLNMSAMTCINENAEAFAVFGWRAPTISRADLRPRSDDAGGNEAKAMTRLPLRIPAAAANRPTTDRCRFAVADRGACARSCISNYFNNFQRPET